MTEETARDEDFARRFEDEARPGARVDPPNVVRIYAFGAGTTGAYIVYELIEGESLASVLERGPLAPACACALARDIAAGLAALQEARIIHRDLKPAVVLAIVDGQLARTPRIRRGVPVLPRRILAHPVDGASASPRPA